MASADPERPGTLAEALIQLQARLPRITKDAVYQIGGHDVRYAKLDQIYDAVFPLLGDLGLYWSCCPTLMDGRFVLDYQLYHVSGASTGGQFPLPDGVSSQAMGSAITYAERYSFNAVIGIAPADDDGAAATAEWHPPADPRKHRVTRARNTAADEDPWATGPAADDTPGSITDAQLVAIQDYWLSLGIAAEDRPALVIAATNRQGIKRTRDLSKTEGDKLISYLREKEQASEGGA